MILLDVNLNSCVSPSEWDSTPEPSVIPLLGQRFLYTAHLDHCTEPSLIGVPTVGIVNYRFTDLVEE